MTRVFRPLLFVLALLGASPGCRSDELVELRLYPCEFAGIEPQAVTIEITGFDAQDNVVETHEVSFDDIAATTFADGYASVGYRKHGNVVRARFRVGWFEAAEAGSLTEANAIAVYEELDVPGAGEVLVLGELAADCAELIADGTEATSNESGDTQSDTQDTSSSEDVDTSSSDDMDSSSSDDMDSSSSDDMDSSSSDTQDTTDEDTTDTSGDPPGPKPGDDCSALFGFYCTGGPTPEDAGIPLLCNDQMKLESTDAYPGACVDICADLMLGLPVNACSNIGDATCACQAVSPPNCDDELLGCFGNELHLCFEGKIVVSDCVDSCGMTPEGWFTCE